MAQCPPRGEASNLITSDDGLPIETAPDADFLTFSTSMLIEKSRVGLRCSRHEVNLVDLGLVNRPNKLI